MRYFEEDFLIIEEDQANSIAIMEWQGLAKTEKYRLGFSKFTELLRERSYDLWLFDYKKGKVIDVKDQTWTIEEWFPEAISSLDGPIKKLAIVLSDDIFNKVSVKIITDKVGQDYELDIAFFEIQKDAREWLNTIEETGQVAEH